MTGLYGRLEDTARRLIASYGKTGSIVRITTGGPPHNPTTTEAQHACTLVETGYSLTNRNETLIQVGDKVGIISTDLNVTPVLADKLVIDGARFNLVDLKPLNPGGTVLLWEFVARA